jgi:hypothetical protein
MSFAMTLLKTAVNSNSEPLPELFEFMPRAAKLFLGATGMFAISAYTNFPYQHGKAGVWNVEVYFWLSVFMFLGEAFLGSLVHRTKEKENHNAAHLGKAKIYVGVVGVVNLGFLIFRVLPGVDFHGDIGALIGLVVNLFTILFSFSKSAAVFYILRNMKRRLDAGEDASLDGASSDLKDEQTAAQRQQPGMDIETEMTAVSTPMHNDGGKDTIPVASKA